MYLQKVKHLEGHWQKDPGPDPGSYQNVTNPGHCQQERMPLFGKKKIDHRIDKLIFT
jgi:hypothetical protein